MTVHTEAHSTTHNNKRGEEKGREGKGREGKGREGKGREGKGREGKGREGNTHTPTDRRSVDKTNAIIEVRKQTRLHIPTLLAQNKFFPGHGTWQRSLVASLVVSSGCQRGR